jgi:hypothetical protein
MKKLNVFLAELDRDRTRLEVFSDVSIGIAHIGAEAAKELEPVQPLINSILRILGLSQDNDVKALPPSETKQITAASREEEEPEDNREDKIPF